MKRKFCTDLWKIFQKIIVNIIYNIEVVQTLSEYDKMKTKEIRNIFLSLFITLIENLHDLYQEWERILLKT